MLFSRFLAAEWGAAQNAHYDLVLTNKVRLYYSQMLFFGQ
jgi:hypothetical protein